MEIGNGQKIHHKNNLLHHFQALWKWLEMDGVEMHNLLYLLENAFPFPTVSMEMVGNGNGLTI